MALRSTTPTANDKLHQALQIRPRSSTDVTKALADIKEALSTGANIHSTCSNSLKGTKETEVTVLHSAAMLMNTIEFEIKAEAEKNKAKQALFELIKYLIENGANPNAKMSSGTAPLNYLLPIAGPVYGVNDLTWHTKTINYLVSKGAYEIRDGAISSTIKHYSNNHLLVQCLKKIKCIKAIQNSVLNILQQECKRLTDKEPTEEDDFKSHNHFLCCGSGIQIDDYSTRRDTLKTAIDDLNRIIKRFSEGIIDKKQCGKQARESINTHLIKQEKLLDKYNEYEQMGRGFLNVLLVIFTGIIPGLIKYGLTGTWYVSIVGNTREMAHTANQNLENIFRR